MYKKIIIQVLGIAALFLVVLLALSNGKGNTSKSAEIEGAFEPVVVLELFTSQGCSSCPPADVLLEKAKRQFPEKVFALSYHVDYWNYIGWEDPFSKAQYTKKQGAYNRKFNYRGNYTPEMVINGKEHFVGSNSSKLFGKIKQYGNVGAQNGITIFNVKRSGNDITFDYTVEGDISGILLHSLLVLDERTTNVKRGENRNRTLTNSNIVVAEAYKDLNEKSNSARVTVPSLVRPDDKLTLMVLTESTNLNITGASKKKV